MNSAQILVLALAAAVVAVTAAPMIRDWLQGLRHALGPLWPFWAGPEPRPGELEELEQQHATLAALSPADIDWAAGHGLDVPAELQRLRGAVADAYRMRSQTPPPPFARPGIDTPARHPIFLAEPRDTPGLGISPREGQRRAMVRMGYIEKPDGSYRPGPVDLLPTEPRRMVMERAGEGLHGQLVTNPEWVAWAREHRPFMLPPEPDPDWGTK